MLLDGFDGNLTSSKWAKICKVSQDTAFREIQGLVAKGILMQVGNGRSTPMPWRRTGACGCQATARAWSCTTPAG